MLLVARIHQAVVYDIPTAAAPEKAIAKSKKFRVSGGLFKDDLGGQSHSTPSNPDAYKLRLMLS